MILAQDKGRKEYFSGVQIPVRISGWTTVNLCKKNGKSAEWGYLWIGQKIRGNQWGYSGILLKSFGLRI